MVPEYWITTTVCFSQGLCAARLRDDVLRILIMAGSWLRLSTRFTSGPSAERKRGLGLGAEDTKIAAVDLVHYSSRDVVMNSLASPAKATRWKDVELKGWDW